METFTMSRKEVPRAGLVKAALAGKITNQEGARALRLTVRRCPRMSGEHIRPLGSVVCSRLEVRSLRRGCGLGGSGRSTVEREGPESRRFGTRYLRVMRQGRAPRRRSRAN